MDGEKIRGGGEGAGGEGPPPAGANRPAGPFLAAAAVVLLALVWAVFGRTTGHGFIAFDDPGYVTDNPAVLRGLSADGVRWAFTTFEMANWHPLVWLDLMADVSLFGPSPAWFHGMNVLLHALNSVLLLLLLHRLSGSAGAAALAAALFAVHPLHVESVAWVSERKDLLCALFVLLSLLSWRRHVERPSAGAYGGALGAFALALLSKPMAVSLPLLLLLLDLWPFRRLRAPAGPAGEGAPAPVPAPPRRLLAEKAPFLLLAALSSAVTIAAQRGAGAMGRLDEFPLPDRVGNALVSAVAYLGKAAWPSSLSFFYPHPSTLGEGVPAVKAAAAAAVLLLLSLLAWRERGRRPWIAFGWLWYLVTLAPVAGIVQVGSQAMADRYTYLPLVGIFLAVALAGEEAARRLRIPPAATAALAAAVVAALSVAAWRQAGYWKDSETLYSRAVAVTERNWLAMNNLGEALYRRGEYGKAEEWYRESMRHFPSDPTTWNNLGTVLERTGRGEEGAAAYREAVRLSPAFQAARVNLGAALRDLGRPAEAEAALREALRLDPRDGAAWNHLATTLVRLGRLPEAVEAYRSAIEAAPSDPLPRYNLALAFDRLGDPAAAEGAYREAVRLRPDFPEAWVNLGLVQAKQGRFGEGARSVEEALRHRPDDAAAAAILEEIRRRGGAAP